MFTKRKLSLFSIHHPSQALKGASAVVRAALAGIEVRARLRRNSARINSPQTVDAPRLQGRG